MATCKFRIETDGLTQEHSFELETGIERIAGRDSPWLRVKSAAASRKHCSFNWDGRQLWVQDLGSTHGTFVNDKRVQKQALKTGDVIAVGDAKITIEALGEEITAAKIITSTPSKKMVPNPFAKPSGSRSAPITPKAHQVISAPAEQYEEEPSSCGWSFEEIGFDFAQLCNTYKAAYFTPKQFFRSADYGGSLGTSLAIIAGTGFLSTLLFMWWTLFMAIPMALFSMVTSCIGAIIFSGLMHILTPITGAKGDFAKYVRFAAVALVAMLPLSLLAAIPVLGWILLAPAMLIAFVWFIAGFIFAFEARPAPTVGAFVGIFIFSTFINGSIMTAKMANNPSSAKIAEGFLQAMAQKAGDSSKNSHENTSPQDTSDAAMGKILGAMKIVAAAKGDKKMAEEITAMSSMGNYMSSMQNHTISLMQNSARLSDEMFTEVAAIAPNDEAKVRSVCATYQSRVEALATEMSQKLIQSLSLIPPEVREMERIKEKEKSGALDPEKIKARSSREVRNQSYRQIIFSLRASDQEIERAQAALEMMKRAPSSAANPIPTSPPKAMTPDQKQNAQKFMDCALPTWEKDFGISRQ